MSRYQRRELRDVANHDGTRRARGDRFFALPDDDVIGDVVSASTSSTPGRWEWTFLNTIVAGAIGMIALGASTPTRTGFDPRWWGFPLGAAVAGALAWLWGPPVRCSYVGTDGVHQAWKVWRFWPRKRAFCFADAVSCELTFTRVFSRGYDGTNVRATWRDARSRVVFRLQGGFREYRIDRDETDLVPLERQPPDAPARFTLAAVAEYRRYQQWQAEQEAGA